MRRKNRSSEQIWVVFKEFVIGISTPLNNVVELQKLHLSIFFQNEDIFI